MSDATTVQQELGRDECLALLRQAPVGRIAMSVSALPVVIPVRFVVLDEEIIFRAISGAPLDISEDVVVALQADDWDDDRSGGWTVLVQGVASRRGAPTPAQAIALGAADAGVARMDATIVHGRRFGA